jgi:hypothetical protein
MEVEFLRFGFVMGTWFISTFLGISVSDIDIKLKAKLLKIYRNVYTINGYHM